MTYQPKLWHIWQAVATPPRPDHPLYQRGVSTAFRINNVLSCTLIFGALLFIMPLILFISTVIGAIAAATSSSAVSQERQAGRFALWAVTPMGEFGASWLLGLGAVHRRDAFRRLQSWRTWVFRGAFVLVGYVMLEVIIVLSTSAPLWELPVIFLGLVLVMSGFYIDHIQALTLGVLVGLAMPTYAGDRIGAQTGAVVFYLFLRVLTILAAILLMFGILGPLFGLLPRNFITLTGLRLLQFAAFVAVNEAVIAVVWAVLKSRLYSDAESLQLWRLPA